MEWKGNRIFIIIMFFCGCRKSPEIPSQRNLISSPVFAEANVSKSLVEPLETFTINFSVDWEKGFYPIIPPFEEGITGLRIVDDKVEEKIIEGRHLYKRSFSVKADIEGVFHIPSFAIPFTSHAGERGNVQTDEIYIQAGWPEGLTEGMRDIVDIKGIIYPPPHILFFLLPPAILLAGIFAYTAYRLRGRKKNLSLPDPPWVRALRDLEMLEKRDLLARGNFREFYYSLSEIFRRYLEEIYNFPALEMTSEEIVREIYKKNFYSEEIRNFIEISDLPKYAGKTLSEEMCKKHLQLVRNFVENSKRELEGEEI